MVVIGCLINVARLTYFGCSIDLSLTTNIFVLSRKIYVGFYSSLVGALSFCLYFLCMECVLLDKDLTSLMFFSML